MIDAAPFQCDAPYILDGDTIECSHGPRVRLARIDAPELPRHCRAGRHCAPGDPYASKAALVALIDRRTLTCTPIAATERASTVYDRYGRTVARCRVGSTDIGSYMVAHGWARVWP